MESVDILINNGWVLTMDPEDTLIEKGAVAVGEDLVLAASYKAAKTVDARGGIIMPGLVNAHTHAAMTCFRGIADDLPLMTWLNDHIFPAEAKLTFGISRDAPCLCRDDPLRNHHFLRHVSL